MVVVINCLYAENFKSCTTVSLCRGCWHMVCIYISPFCLKSLSCIGANICLTAFVHVCTAPTHRKEIWGSRYSMTWGFSPGFRSPSLKELGDSILHISRWKKNVVGDHPGSWLYLLEQISQVVDRPWSFLLSFCLSLATHAAEQSGEKRVVPWPAVVLSWVVHPNSWHTLLLGGFGDCLQSQAHALS